MDGTRLRGADTYHIQLLIYSAATNTGMHTIQQARIYYPQTLIIAIASSQHHARLRELGADATFDYKSSTLVSDAQALGRDIRKALDCHSEGPSTAMAAKCMLPGRKALVGNSGAGQASRRIIRTLPPSMMSGSVPAGVKADEWILSYTALGKVHLFSPFHTTEVGDYVSRSATLI